MRNIILVTFLTFFCTLTYSQVTFQQGHFIDNNGETVHCLIKNREWRENPLEFEYKLNENSKPQIATIDMVREFTIDDSRKYIRATVDIDKSSTDLKKIDDNIEPDFEEETLFLQSLIEGKASLYYYRKDGVDRFFYQVDDSNIEQLIYKVFLVDDKRIKHNERYKQQLFNNVNCGEISVEDVQKLRYQTRRLLNYFINYNSCTDSDYIVQLNRGKASLNGNLKGGINLTNFGIQQIDHPKNNEFTLDPNLRLGVELELVLPIVNNKWSVFFEPTYFQYKAEREFLVYMDGSLPSNPGIRGSYRATGSINTTGIELPVGLRHYIFMTNTSRLFFNGGISFHFMFNSSSIDPISEHIPPPPELTVEQSWTPSFFAGGGYDFNSQFSFEARYYPIKPVSDNGIFEINQDHTFALILGYKLF